MIRIKVLVEGQTLLQAIRDQFPNTAPSKRILKIFPYYKKVLDGSVVAKAVGLDKIRQECHHFDSWVTRLSQCQR